MSPIVHEYYRVPREDRAVYMRPAPRDLAALVERNRRLVGGWQFELAGRPFHEFRAAARAEIVALATEYTRRCGCRATAWTEPQAIIVTGHQPPPVHPGVWIKNFLAWALAEAVGGAALNLTVDNDAGHVLVLRFPVRAALRGADGRDAETRQVGRPAAQSSTAGVDGYCEEVRMAEIPLAPHDVGLALEEVPASALRPEAIHEALGVLPAGPIADGLRRSWVHLVEAMSQTESLAEALAVGRRRLEEELGLANLELPVSRMADGETFRLLVAEMLRRPDEFFGAYNDSLAEYRRVYRERSSAQPVPDLARDGERLELPLWIWHRGLRRRRLWVEPADGGRLRLLADRDEAGVLSAGDVASPVACAARLAELRRAGWKIRPRALAMMLYVRLALGDVFIHGLGGALYDKITDGIFERMFGGRAPEIVLASATVHLPLESYPSTAADLEAARRAVRDWRYNPDRKLGGAIVGRAEVAALVAEKQRLIVEREPTRDGRRRAWQRVRQINAELAALDPAAVEAAGALLVSTERQLRYNSILRNRECAYWLYPPEELAAFYREAIFAAGLSSEKRC